MQTCERAKYLLKSGRRLQFSLLILLKYANPGNMASLLHKSSSRMNARYWRWFNRKSDQKRCDAHVCSGGAASGVSAATWQCSASMHSMKLPQCPH